MKAKEVMELLDISRRTLTRYITKGIIKGTRLPTGQYIYDDESVYKLADKKNYTKVNKIIKDSKKSGVIIYIVNNKQGENICIVKN